MTGFANIMHFSNKELFIPYLPYLGKNGFAISQDIVIFLSELGSGTLAYTFEGLSWQAASVWRKPLSCRLCIVGPRLQRAKRT